MPYDLDHVALAAADTSDALRFLTGRLGATVLFGGQGVGFRPMQLRVGDADDGMNVELLEPWATERNDFLVRFLARHGPGPHHLTFKVPDLVAALDRVRAAGHAPVGVDASDPAWKEAFLVPREAHGTVVQLAEAHPDIADRGALLAHVARHGPDGRPRWWVDPERSPGPPRALRRVVVGSPSPAGTVAFYRDLLGGTPVDTSEGRTELAWPGGAHVRVEARPDRPPGIDRLEVDGLDAAHTVLGTRFTPA